MDYTSLKSSIKKHEGKRYTLYKDSEGVSTIGYGHNLENNPLSEKAIEQILDDDIQKAVEAARVFVPYYEQLNDVRQEVVVEMIFNLGHTGFSKFIKMKKALSEFDYDRAALEMINSKWAGQVGERAVTLSRLMKTGSY